MMSRTRLSALGCLLVGWAVSAGCGGSDDAPPSSSGKPPGTLTEVAREPLTCDDLGTMNEWGPTLCETGGNNACGGEGEATSDCAHCCPGDLPTSQELAAQKGWAGVACENDGDGACNGLGEDTVDCDEACEAPAPPPTCAVVAAEWGFEQAVCETGGNGACGGKGVVTSDCARCCDVPPPADAGPEFGDDMAEFNEDPVEEEENEPAEPPPPPDPGPTSDKACGVIGTELGWANAVCETSTNNACGGKGLPSANCKLCCEGTDGSGTNPSTAQGTLNVVTYNLSGATKKQLNVMARELRKARPTVVGLQEATESQMHFLADRLGSTKMPMDYRHFAPVRQEGSTRVGLALVSKLPLDGVESESLPGGGKLLRATVTTPNGPFPFGTAWLGDAESAAARLATAMGGDHALVALGFEPGSTQSALKVIKAKLSDGWSDSFGAGLTTADGKRPDMVVRSGTWSGTLKGQVVGAAEGSAHRAVVHSYDPKKLGAHCQGSACQGGKNPVITGNAADPVIVRDGDTYHLFATSGIIEHRTSPDLLTWTDASPAFAQKSSWEEKDGNKGQWAPGVYQAGNGNWMMYFVAQREGPSEQRCIGKARSGSPGETFQHEGKFICESARWSIDASVFSKGKQDFLLWRQDTAAQPRGTIHIQRLTGQGDLTGPSRQLLSRASQEPSWEFKGNVGVMENPAMVHHQGRYHLFYSGNDWETASYATGHALCAKPMGDCTKASVKKPWVKSRGGMVGPGGADVVKMKGGTRIMYLHAWDPDHIGPGNPRQLWVYRLVLKKKKAKLKPL